VATLRRRQGDRPGEASTPGARTTSLVLNSALQ
jgi:hypothetical protein